MNKFKNYLLATTGFVIFMLTVALMDGGRAEGSGTLSNTPGSAPTPTSTGTAPVTVLNTTSNPVPTSPQGTTTISGNVNVSNTPTVNAQQNGLWSVGILGTPTFGLSPSANAVQAQQNGPWSVGISGTPTFGISQSANTIQAQQNGSWNVGITGTPNVNIAGTPTVALAAGSTVQLGTQTAPVLVRDVDNPGKQRFRQIFSLRAPDCSDEFVVPVDKRLVIELVNISVFADPGRTLLVELTSPGTRVTFPLKLQGTFDILGGRDLLVANEPVRLYFNPNEHFDICTSIQRNDQSSDNEANVSLSGYFVDVP